MVSGIVLRRWLVLLGALYREAMIYIREDLSPNRAHLMSTAHLCRGANNAGHSEQNASAALDYLHTGPAFSIAISNVNTRLQFLVRMR